MILWKFYQNKMINNTKIVFLGSSKFSVYCLEELKSQAVLPTLIITTPDMPTGRGLKLTPTPVKIWAEQNNIECLAPNKLDADFLAKLTTHNLDLSLVASYGKIIPKNIIDLPKHNTLNIHPSLLPKYRGPSPLQEQILNDEKNVGITIMQIDEQVDHGSIVSQKKLDILDWPVKFENLEKITAEEGVKLFVEILTDWILGKIKPTEQIHSEATFTKKVEKADGLIDILTGDPYKNFLQIQAYSTWPHAFFFVQKGEQKIRVIVKEAEFKDGNLIIKKVLPEGKKEMPYEDFLRGLK